MRNILLLFASAGTLAACGGGGVQSISSVAAPAPTPVTSTPTPTHSFVTPTEARTYTGVGAAQSYAYQTRSDRDLQTQQLYQGDAGSVRNSGIQVAYNPRDAIFSITINQQLAGTSVAARFQDPLHRTAFGGLREPQNGTPNLPAQLQIQYLQSGSATGTGTGVAGGYNTGTGQEPYSSDQETFFYQKPGTTTKYVTFAGYLRNRVGSALVGLPNGSLVRQNDYTLDRAAFAWGEMTDSTRVPKTGSGTYTGDMLATMAFNDRRDVDSTAPTFLQWISGTQTTTVDFAKLSVATTMTGTVLAPTLDQYTSGIGGIAAGTAFSATAQSTIDLTSTGGFTGNFSTAKFSSNGTDTVLLIAGSSIDGAFYGPNAEEVGGGFRIVGGRPDERIDILGAFTGKK